MSTVEHKERRSDTQSLKSNVYDIWNATHFATEELAAYAGKFTLDDTRSGLIALSLMTTCLFGLDIVLFDQFGFFEEASYTCGLLSLLSIHILVSTRTATDTRSLYLLGATLLLMSGTAFVLLANTVGDYNLALFASVTMLIIVIPIVPWGLREGTMLLALIYSMFTLATWGARNSFDPQAAWSLQYIMLGAGAVSLAIVARNTAVRKADIRTRYELERTKDRLTRLSNKDPLTEAWNRRFLKDRFVETVDRWHAADKTYHFAFIDLDDFKAINDTLGHDFGDLVLRYTSDAFNNITSGEGHVVRMGGDEFALLFTSHDPEGYVSECLVNFQQRLASRSRLENPVKISIGMVSVPPGTEITQEQVYKAADEALYAAKDRKYQHTSELNLIRADLDTLDLESST